MRTTHDVVSQLGDLVASTDDDALMILRDLERLGEEGENSLVQHRVPAAAARWPTFDSTPHRLQKAVLESNAAFCWAIVNVALAALCRRRISGGCLPSSRYLTTNGAKPDSRSAG